MLEADSTFWLHLDANSHAVIFCILIDPVNSLAGFLADFPLLQVIRMFALLKWFPKYGSWIRSNFLDFNLVYSQTFKHTRHFFLNMIFFTSCLLHFKVHICRLCQLFSYNFHCFAITICCTFLFVDVNQLLFSSRSTVYACRYCRHPILLRFSSNHLKMTN